MHDHVKYDDLCIDKFEPKLSRDVLINEWGGARKMYGAYVFLLFLCCSCRGGGELVYTPDHAYRGARVRACCCLEPEASEPGTRQLLWSLNKGEENSVKLIRA